MGSNKSLVALNISKPPELRVIGESKDTTMSRTLRLFVWNESGATAIEYALIASLVSVAIVVSVSLMGTRLSSTYSNIAAAFP